MEGNNKDKGRHQMNQKIKTQQIGSIKINRQLFANFSMKQNLVRPINIEEKSRIKNTRAIKE